MKIIDITIRNAADYTKEKEYTFPLSTREIDEMKEELAAPWQLEAEELMAIDYEESGFYEIFGEFPDFSTLSEVLDSMPEDWTAEMLEFAIEADSTNFDPDEFIFYNANSLEELGEEIADNWVIPDYLKWYIDYERVAKDYLVDMYGSFVSGKNGDRYYMAYVG